jgi:hypothetical protein
LLRCTSISCLASGKRDPDPDDDTPLVLFETADEEMDVEDENEEKEQDDEDEEKGNISVSTVASTIQRRDRQRISDFAIIRWYSDDVKPLLEKKDVPAVFADAEPEIITPVFRLLEHIFVLIEIKRAPSCKLERNTRAWTKRFTSLLNEAKYNVAQQVSHSYHQLTVH